MQRLNVEFKARCCDLGAARLALETAGASDPTVDHQIDTYFLVSQGRLKLRDGSVERALIYYDRPDSASLKPSRVTLFPVGSDANALKAVLTSALGVLAVVDKRREIWWLGEVKIHLDVVAGLGTFVEAEAIGDVTSPEDDLRARCDAVRRLLGVTPEDMLRESYSDLVLARRQGS